MEGVCERGKVSGGVCACLQVRLGTQTEPKRVQENLPIRHVTPLEAMQSTIKSIKVH